MSIKEPTDSLFSRSRAGVLGVLVMADEPDLHVREIARRVGLDATGVHRELRKLEELGVVLSRRSGRQKYYSMNSACPIHDELAGIIRKTVGLADVLRTALAPWAASIELAYIYGSQASGNAKPASDVDVMVVGDVSSRDLPAALDSCREQLRREINVTVYPLQEYQQKLNLGRGFIHQVHHGTKIMLLGDVDGLS